MTNKALFPFTFYELAYIFGAWPWAANIFHSGNIKWTQIIFNYYIFYDYFQSCYECCWCYSTALSDEIVAVSVASVLRSMFTFVLHTSYLSPASTLLHCTQHNLKWVCSLTTSQILNKRYRTCRRGCGGGVNLKEWLMLKSDCSAHLNRETCIWAMPLHPTVMHLIQWTC